MSTKSEQVHCYLGQTKTITPYSPGATYYLFKYMRCTVPTMNGPNGAWTGINNPYHGIYYSNNNTSFTFHNIGYNDQTCSEPPMSQTTIGKYSTLPQLLTPYDNGYNIYLRYAACNSAGCSEWSTLYTNVRFFKNPPPPPPGGCPYVFTTNNDSTFSSENNILHKSKFTQFLNQDIEDRYLLKNSPSIIDNNYVIVLGEINEDIDYYDQVKLLAIDHPINTKVGITEDNQIVIYDSTQVVSTNQAIKNGTDDITESIQYIPVPRAGAVFGDSLDHLLVQFTGPNLNTHAVITQMEKNIQYPYPTVKDWAGNINIQSNDGSTFTKTFARREFESVNIIPLDLKSSDDNILDINVNMLKNYHLKYLSLVPISYSGFTVTELNIAKGYIIDSAGQYQIDSTLLSYDDGNYLTMDNTMHLVLHFNTLGNNNRITSRSYILKVNGKYIEDPDTELIKKNLKKDNMTLDKVRLYANYPNPFNPKTIIKFELSKPENVELKVYNSLGQLVNTLVNTMFVAGTHFVEFDATNLPSGVYFYTIETKSHSESRKMVLIK